jgi:pyridoxamine 5'-phosphate oxidase family protein
MSAFTDNELAYLREQRLGRIATQQPDGTLQNSPVGFAYNPATDTIDISGHNMGTSRKFKNVADNGRVAFVVDDLAPGGGWRPRFLEIRGWAEALTAAEVPAAQPIVAGPFIRIHPTRILAFGLDEPDAAGASLNGMPFNARDVPRADA